MHGKKNKGKSGKPIKYSLSNSGLFNFDDDIHNLEVYFSRIKIFLL